MLNEMKRLQFRRNAKEVFNSREAAIEYLNILVNEDNIKHLTDGSLYGEPIVVKYTDEDGKEQLILAIGKDNGFGTELHIIDSAKLIEDITENREAIAAEVVRAQLAEEALDEKIMAEEARAKGVEENLQQQITDNISNIVLCNHELAANVLKEYVLVNGKGDEMGEHIKIYKDSALVDAQMSWMGATGVTFEDGVYKLHYDVDAYDDTHEFLYLIYKDENNDLKFVSIDFEKFVMETEFGDGLVVAEGTHKVSVRLNEMAAEQYLKVDENGLKTDGIDEAIANSANGVLEEAKKYADEKKEEAISASSAYTDEQIALEHECHTKADEEVYESAVTYTDSEVEKLQKQIDANKIYSGDLLVETSEDGTKLTVLVDGLTIGKEVDYDDKLARLKSLLTVAKVEPSNASVKAQYELRDGSGNTIGEPIMISKESALSSVAIGKLGDVLDVKTGSITSAGEGNDTLNFVYLKTDGTYELVAIEISKYFTDAHFGRGLQNHDGVVSLKEGDGNEYLVINDDSISVCGVNDAIANASSATLESSKVYVNEKVADLTYSIDNLTNVVKDTIGMVDDRLSTEISARTANDAVLEEKCDSLTIALNNAVNSINDVSEATNDIKNELLKEISATSANGIVDVIFEENYIRLLRSNGDKTIGFDASDFLVDSVLKGVDIEGDKLIFEWNDENKTRVEISLDKFKDIYVSADERFISVSGNEVSAIVDYAKGFSNTLASTDLVKNVANSALTESKAYTDELITNLSGSVETFISASSKDLEAKVQKNAEAIERLNGKSDEQGSVLHIVEDGFANKIITDGLPATNITVDEAKNVHSLIKVVNVNGVNEYYASNKAEDMLYTKEDGTTQNLNEYISSLEARVKELELNLRDTIIDVLSDVLVGTDKEIKITSVDGKMKIGFTDDAIFGEE